MRAAKYHNCRWCHFTVRSHENTIIGSKFGQICELTRIFLLNALSLLGNRRWDNHVYITSWIRDGFLENDFAAWSVNGCHLMYNTHSCARTHMSTWTWMRIIFIQYLIYFRNIWACLVFVQTFTDCVDTSKPKQQAPISMIVFFHPGGRLK